MRGFFETSNNRCTHFKANFILTCDVYAVPGVHYVVALIAIVCQWYFLSLEVCTKRVISKTLSFYFGTRLKKWTHAIIRVFLRFFNNTWSMILGNEVRIHFTVASSFRTGSLKRKQILLIYKKYSLENAVVSVDATCAHLKLFFKCNWQEVQAQYKPAERGISYIY